ncbi:MAG: hypothetical protein ABL974_09360 [Prosthecobacter sp.]
MNSTILHIATHHVPIIGLVCGLSVLVVGRFNRSLVILRGGLWLLIASGILASPAYLMGSPSEEMVERPFNAVFLILPSVLLAGILSAIAQLLLRRGRAVGAIISAIVTIVSVETAGNMVWAAKRHSEGDSDPVLQPAEHQVAALPIHHVTVAQSR